MKLKKVGTFTITPVYGEGHNPDETIKNIKQMLGDYFITFERTVYETDIFVKEEELKIK